ncbi:MAG: hypothetical protein KatS3mg043_1408 [Rhodothermaceae bacterium]|nr:MAG: hypothetical protein KatS3mg043_1408 [Rhodothermaceae bacterium]
MQLLNDTPLAHGLAVGLGPERRPCLAVIVKGTFELPGRPGDAPALAPEQLPVLTEDEFFDGDATGSLRLERDNVPFKPRADVVLVGTAYAPGGRPVRSLDVSVRVGRLQKIVRVFGDRHWMFPTRLVMVPLISDPEPFTEMPLRYEHAFGGFDRKAHKYFNLNYVGKGFLGKKTRESVDGRPLPNLEDPRRLISSWDDEPPPAGFGFYSPHCVPRIRYAGTERGYAQPHPLFGLAADFDPAFYNGAHPDLQAPGYLRGDEEVELVGVTPDGLRRFRLPNRHPAVSLRPVASGDEAAGPQPLPAPLDTLVFLPDEGVFYQVWRAVYPLGEVNDPAALEAALLGIAEVRIRLPGDGAGPPA